MCDLYQLNLVANFLTQLNSDKIRIGKTWICNQVCKQKKNKQIVEVL